MRENFEQISSQATGGYGQMNLQEGGGRELLELSEKLPIEEIKRRLLDPRSISKKHNRVGRLELVDDVNRWRREDELVSGEIEKSKDILSEIEQQADVLGLAQVGKVSELEQRMEEILVRFKNLFGIKDKMVGMLGVDIHALKKEIDMLVAEANEVRIKIEQLQHQQSEIPKTAELLRAYYEKMMAVPLTNEEKRELLKPEVLAELSTEEYIALWRRLNPHFLSHVTRQGFRDHNAMIYHSAGMQEFHNGLVSVLEDGKIIRPPIAVRNGLRSRDESMVRNFLEDWVLKADDEEGAKERLSAQLNHTVATAPKYPDKTAVHFAAQIVVDDSYGGERNNEAFFIYPSDVLASQHDFAFNGFEKTLVRPQSEAKWNDILIWPNSLDNVGIAVDSGFVFLPENTLVDPETGSRYASEIRIVGGEEKRAMIEDEEHISAFVLWAESLSDESPAIRALKEYNEKRSGSWTDRQNREKACFEVFRNEIVKLGFSEDAAMNIVYSLFSSIDGIYQYQENGQLGFGDSKKDAAIKKLRSANANWKMAENTITSRGYWERFFSKYPERKPKHLIFYDGDPTIAVYKFQQENGIGRADVSDTEGELLGFEDKHVLDMEKDPRANVGYDALVETSHRIIEEQYRQ